MKPEVNSRGVSDRRSASPRRQSDATESTYPVITRSVYNEMQTALNRPADMNLKMARLCTGRIKLYQAKLVIDSAMRDFNPQVPIQKEPREEDRKTYNRLRAISAKLEKMVLEYPLTILNP